METLNDFFGNFSVAHVHLEEYQIFLWSMLSNFPYFMSKLTKVIMGHISHGAKIPKMTLKRP